jgi:hypothetical protein
VLEAKMLAPAPKPGWVERPALLLERLHRAAGLIVAPESLGESVRRDGLRRVQRQCDEQRPLFDTVEPNRGARNLDLERPKRWVFARENMGSGIR